jgi:dihydroxyacetone kinase
MSGELRAAILSAADAVEAAREALCALDAETGDGDHGVTMTIGARGVRRGVSASPDDDPAVLVRAAASGMAGAGGAIGPLYSRALTAIASALDDTSSADPPLTVARLRRCAEAALEAVEALGHARPGDKTIVDVLAPVAAALAAADEAGRPVGAAIEDARGAADAGAAATTAMVAAIGRSSRFGERSRGTPDPGASSCALIIDALADQALADLARPRPEGA